MPPSSVNSSAYGITSALQARSCDVSPNAGSDGGRPPAIHGPTPPKHHDVSIGRVGCDRCHELRAALSPPPKHPRPEVAPSAAATERPPPAQPQWHVEHDHRVSAGQPVLQIVIWTEVAVHDPASLGSESPLPLTPRVQRHRLKLRTPKLLVELDDREGGCVAQVAGENRLPGAAPTPHDYAVHAHTVHDASVGVSQNACSGRIGVVNSMRESRVATVSMTRS